jgi:beta-lactam-binding protein with PASTA domain
VGAIVLVLTALGAGAVAYNRVSTPSHPVPSLVDDTPVVATRALAPLHFRLRIASRAYDEKVPQGLIISQAQPPTRLLREGSEVPVVVSLGPPLVAVPDLTGLSVQDASNRLIGARLKVGAVSGRFDSSAKGTVLSWSGQGAQLPEGSTVDLVQSNGPPVVAVPSVSGSFGAAQAALAVASLKAAENDVFNNTVPKGQVIATSPGAGTSVQVGSTVTVSVSKGPDLVTVPDVRGQTVDAAANALQAQGFNVVGVNGHLTRSVTGTSPAAGSSVLRGSSVTLITS